MIEFDSSRYQIFVISLIRISAEFPAYNVEIMNSDNEESEITEKGNFSADNITRVAINRAKKDKQP